ncbi:hypothetical protein BJ508DRAFT_124298 [Ascobolus immersus RN42]|uniref:Uncharacterized protein n=1 Tax=Ascobolus immersus RN42 TaxID=1160509 RepID=A0A3N4I613_ASCIM|nr:hypothetical protein BJ508DRAFT_124298 [Ascobolus immersus RN42]
MILGFLFCFLGVFVLNLVMREKGWRVLVFFVFYFISLSGFSTCCFASHLISYFLLDVSIENNLIVVICSQSFWFFLTDPAVCARGGNITG